MRPLVLSMLLAAALVGRAGAQPLITLSSADLSALRLGDTVTVDVMLSGLSAGDELVLLAAEVNYDEQHFGLPTVTSAGIIPDVTGFESDEFANLAGATFESLDTTSGTDMITANGAFFSFDIDAIGLGSGQIAIGFADALGEDLLSNPIDGASRGAALDYTISFSADFDNDLDVDNADLGTWEANFGALGTATRTTGDADDDLDADGRDFLHWQGQFGSEVTVGSLQIVPEPTTVSLMFVLAVSWVLFPKIFGIHFFYEETPINPASEA